MSYEGTSLPTIEGQYTATAVPPRMWWLYEGRPRSKSSRLVGAAYLVAGERMSIPLRHTCSLSADGELPSWRVCAVWDKLWGDPAASRGVSNRDLRRSGSECLGSLGVTDSRDILGRKDFMVY